MESSIDFKRKGVIALYLSGKPQADIVRALEHLNVNKSLVSRTIARYRETGSVAKRHGGGHKKTATSAEMIQKVKARIERNPCRSGRDMARELNISLERVQHILKNELGIKPFTPSRGSRPKTDAKNPAAEATKGSEQVIKEPSSKEDSSGDILNPEKDKEEEPIPTPEPAPENKAKKPVKSTGLRKQLKIDTLLIKEEFPEENVVVAKTSISEEEVKKPKGRGAPTKKATITIKITSKKTTKAKKSAMAESVVKSNNDDQNRDDNKKSTINRKRVGSNVEEPAPLVDEKDVATVPPAAKKTAKGSVPKKDAKKPAAKATKASKKVVKASSPPAANETKGSKKDVKPPSLEKDPPKVPPEE